MTLAEARHDNTAQKEEAPHRDTPQHNEPHLTPRDHHTNTALHYPTAPHLAEVHVELLEEDRHVARDGLVLHPLGEVRELVARLGRDSPRCEEEETRSVRTTPS